MGVHIISLYKRLDLGEQLRMSAHQPYEHA